MERRNLLKMGIAMGSGAAVYPQTERRNPGNFIDAHVHVWTNDFKQYPLADNITVAQMSPPTFFPDDILRLAKPSGVNRIVLIQMSYYRFDNKYMLDVIRKQPKVFRGVAIVDWNATDPSGRMKELAKHGVRGFRISPRGTPPDQWLETPGLQEMFRSGATNNLAMCPLIDPSALPALNRQCEKHRETPVVIDHISRIGAGGPIRESDIDELCKLAKYPRVKVKLSAFYALGAKQPPHLDLIPMIRRVYDSFGPRRLMWASDCPFQTVKERYEDSISLVRDRLDFLSAEDKTWILWRTAEESFFS
jgi:predicted TIM-barrel fold metal-dependent hydrolase